MKVLTGVNREMKKILYVEDNEDTADAVKIILSSEGYKIEIAMTGKDGLKKALENDFNLILLDIMLPDISGWEVFKHLKKKLKTKYAFLSAIPISGERLNQIGRAGVSSYIMKPFTKQKLVEEIKEILRNGKDKSPRLIRS